MLSFDLHFFLILSIPLKHNSHSLKPHKWIEGVVCPPPRENVMPVTVPSTGESVIIESQGPSQPQLVQKWKDFLLKHPGSWAAYLALEVLIFY